MRAIIFALLVLLTSCRTYRDNEDVVQYWDVASVREIYVHDTIRENHIERIVLTEKGDTLIVRDTIERERIRWATSHDTIRDTALVYIDREVAKAEPIKERKRFRWFWFGVGFVAVVLMGDFFRKKR